MPKVELDVNNKRNHYESFIHSTGKQPKSSIKGKNIIFIDNFPEHYLKK